MRKCIIITLAMLMLIAMAGCSAAGQSSADVADEADASEQPAETEAALAGTAYECDRFSITVPEGWEYMEVDGGIQIYKMSGEAIMVAYRGDNMNDTEAESQTKSAAEQYGGTSAQEVELLGKTFWATTYMPDGGLSQTHYLRMEDGEMLSIVCAGADHETDPVYANTLNSIIFK